MSRGVKHIRQLITDHGEHSAMAMIAKVARIVRCRVLLRHKTIFYILPNVLPTVLTHNFIPVSRSFLCMAPDHSLLSARTGHHVCVVPSRTFSRYCHHRVELNGQRISIIHSNEFLEDHAIGDAEGSKNRR